ncbi:hypothetical protein [Streptomyces sp. KL116D]|uniref:hypothetical protein n=1 Tax=Streptomyces sp. KL116D TaxID=3045152 RepID=UPI003558D739
MQNFLAGIERLPTRYGPRIENFVTEYLGGRGHPVPFGGRDADLAALDDWLDDPVATPYLLLSAAAGRGKSALLVRWVQRLQTRGHTDVVFVPVSIRYQTNLAAVFFMCLAARLADIHGDTPPATAGVPADIWQGVVSDYLGRPTPQQRLVVVLDGLDEAADWELGPYILPADPPPGLRVVVSARPTGARPTARDWLRLFAWDTTGLGTDRTLDPLSSDGVRRVLEAREESRPTGVAPGERERHALRLHELTDGDPLLLSLYVKDPPERLTGIPAGLDGYLQRWWEDQQALWQSQFGRQEARAVEEQAHAVMSVLACALGPLGAEDVGRVVDPALSTGGVRRALGPLARFLAVGIGADQSYVLSHSRLAEHWRSRQMGRGEVRQTETRFTTWGLEICAAVEGGTLPPHAAPTYAVEYLAAHMQRSGAAPEDWLRLLGSGRERSWLAVEGSAGGFLSDARSCREALHQACLHAVSVGEEPSLAAQEALCTLAENSIGEQARGVSPEMVSALVRQGEWTPAQALAWARQVPGAAGSAAALLAVARDEPPEPSRAHAVEALDIAARAATDSERNDALLATVPAAAQLGATDEALTAAARITAFVPRATAVSRAARHLTDRQLTGLRDLARQAQAWKDTSSGLCAAEDWPSVRAGLVPCLPEAERHSAYDAAIELAYDAPPWERVSPKVPCTWGVGLAAVLPPERRPDLLVLARAVTSVTLRVNLLGSIASDAEPVLRRELVAEAVSLVQAVAHSRDGAGCDPAAEALAQLMPELAVELHGDALRTALDLSGDVAKGQALAWMMPYLTGTVRQAALDAVQSFSLALPRAWVLAAAVPESDPADRGSLARTALDTAHATGDTCSWAALLSVTADALSPSELAGVADEALAMPACSQRTAAISEIARTYSRRGLCEAALKTLHRLPEADDRAAVLLSLAGMMEGVDASRLLDETVRAASSTEGGRFVTCLRYADLTHRPTAEALVGPVLALPFAQERAEGLRLLLPLLPGPLPAPVVDSLRESLAENDRDLSTELMAALVSGGHAREALSLTRADGEHAWLHSYVLENAAAQLEPPEAAEALAGVLSGWDIYLPNNLLDALVKVAPVDALHGVEQVLGRLGANTGGSAALALATRWAQAGDPGTAFRISEEYGWRRWGMWELMKWFRDVFPALDPDVRTLLLPTLPGCTPQGRGLAGTSPSPLLEEMLHALPRDSRAELYRLHTAKALRPPLDPLTLGVLAPLLEEPDRSQALADVWERVGTNADASPWPAGALRSVHPHLPDPWRIEAGRQLLAAAAEVMNTTPPDSTLASYERDTVRLEPIVPHMTERQIRQCLHACRRLADRVPPQDRALLIAQLARKAGVATARSATASEGPWDVPVRVAVAADAGGAEGSELLTAALREARHIGDGAIRPIVWAMLAAGAGPEDTVALTDRFLRAYQELDGVEHRLEILKWAFPWLGPDHRRALLSRAFEEVGPLPWSSGAKHALRALAERSAVAGDAKYALRILGSLPRDAFRSGTVESLIAVLPEAALDEAARLCMDRAADDVYARLTVATALAARRTGAEREELVRYAAALAEQSPRSSDVVQAFRSVRSLPSDVVDRILSRASLDGEEERWFVLGSLADCISDPERLRCEAEAALEVCNRPRAGYALQAMLPALCRADRPEHAMRLLERACGRVVPLEGWVFNQMAPLVPDELSGRLAAAALRQAHYWAPALALDVFSQLVPYVREDDVVRLVRMSPDHPLMLAALARRGSGTLARDLAEQAVEAASAQPDEMPVPTLAGLADLLPPASLATAVVLVVSRAGEDIGNEELDALSLLLRPQAGYSPEDRYLVAHQVMREMCGVERFMTVYVIGLLLPWLGVPARRVSDLLDEVFERWP